jgi:hypothetical protein
MKTEIRISMISNDRMIKALRQINSFGQLRFSDEGIFVLTDSYRLHKDVLNEEITNTLCGFILLKMN